MHEALARQNFEKDVAALTPAYVAQARWTVHCKTFPTLDVTIEHSTPVRLRLTCDSWNEQPPAIQILKSDGPGWSGPLPPGNVFHPQVFICMRGSREYYTRGAHHDDAWDNYRNEEGMTLLGIIQQLATHWRRNMK